MPLYATNIDYFHSLYYSLHVVVLLGIFVTSEWAGWAALALLTFLHKCNVWLQIRNIRNVIRLTKENLEALNAEFGKHQHPPSMYLQVSFTPSCPSFTLLSLTASTHPPSMYLQVSFTPSCPSFTLLSLTASTHPPSMYLQVSFTPSCPLIHPPQSDSIHSSTFYVPPGEFHPLLSPHSPSSVWQHPLIHLLCTSR